MKQAFPSLLLLTLVGPSSPSLFAPKKDPEAVPQSTGGKTTPSPMPPDYPRADGQPFPVRPPLNVF